MRWGRFCLIALFLLTMTITLTGVSRAGDDESAVKETIVSAYVKGIHIDRDITAVEKGFHPSFTMFIRKGEDVRKFTLPEWIESIKKNKEKNPEGPTWKVTHEIPMVSVSGDAAVAKVMIYRDGKLIYSDYMSLYKFEDSWKIVGKIYYSHKD
jgi:hypothetical protein